MKKIIRIASVIALASASLLYVGCTKDFSADLAKTNSEVAAQASKVAALEATVGTLNSTVENLKTTKADAAAVNALQADLEKKIDVLAAALEQTALLAKDAKADAEAVAADLEVEKAKLDSIILVVDTLAIKSDSLRKDVDSLYKNSASMANDIKALTGRVEGLESRITSLVAIPSLTEEIVKYDIDTITENNGEGYIGATIFSAKFAVTPKDAKIDAKDLGLIIKEGLTKGTAHESIDSVYDVTSAVFEDGVLTVSTKIAKDRAEIKTGDGKALYYSLVFNGKDANGTEYSKVSEFVHAKVSDPKLSLKDVVKFVFDGKAVAEKTFADTVSYAKDSTVFKTSLNGYGKVMAEINGEFITLDEFATILGTKASKFVIDTVVTTEDNILTTYQGGKYASATDPGDTWPGDYFNYGKEGHQELLFWFPEGFSPTPTKNFNGINQKTKTIFYKKKGTDNHYYGNKTEVKTKIYAGRGDRQRRVAKLTDNLYIGAKNKGTFNLGTSTEDWYYDFAKSAIKDSFVVENADAAKALGDSALTVTTKDGVFSVKGDKAEKVQVNVDGVKYAKVAADTTYKVEWTTTADLSTKADSTFSAFNWAFKVGPRPADPATIKYAIDTTVRGTKSITKKFDTFANSVAAIKALNNRAEFDKPVIKSITINGKALDFTKNPAANRFSFDSVKDGEVTFKNAAEGTTVVVATAKCAGITFTYEFTLNLTKGATPTFKALTAYLKVEGDKSFSAEIAAPKIDTTTKKGSQGKYIENLNTLKFNQYFVVDTTNAALADLYAVFGTPDTTSTGKFFVSETDYSLVVDKVKFDNKAFAWNPYDSLTANVVAYLVYKPEQVADTIDQVNIKFWTADPIKSVVAKNVTVKHDPTKSDKVDLDSLFVIKDFVDSTVWNENGIVANRTYNYGQTIVYGVDSTWTFSGGTTIKNQITLDRTSNVLTLAAQGATIENAISVEIPFTVTHDLDKFGVAAEDRQGTVKVTFTK